MNGLGFFGRGVTNVDFDKAQKLSLNMWLKTRDVDRQLCLILVGYLCFLEAYALAGN